jgi:PAS domain S-box-containing protein
VPATTASPQLVAVIEASFGHSCDAVVLFGTDGGTLYENDLAQRRKEAFASGRADIDAALAAAFGAGEPRTLEWGDVGPGGVRCWYACTVSAVREGGVVVAALAVSKDVTQLKRSEARLRRSEQLMVDTQGVAHLGTWEWDISEPHATWSAELYRIYGLTPAEYTPSYEAYLTKIHPDDRQRVMDATNRVFQEHVPYSHDERIFRPDGSLRYLHTWAFPVLDDDGKLTKLIGVCQDITDRKAAEEEVLHLNENLERRVAERTRTIERSMKDLEAFHAMVSHDLRAPLSVISGSCDLLDRERGHLPASATKNVERIQRAVTQMTRLVNDLLTLAHVGNAPLEITEVDLSALCEDIVANLRQLGSQGPAPVVSIEAGLRCHADAAFVRTVLDNLIGNAWKYSARVESPRIDVGKTAHDGKLAFYVGDNGAGFDMKDAERLFAPFERLHSAAEFAGTGVGLAAVHRIIERHGGRIWAHSSPGEGATFTFTLG